MHGPRNKRLASLQVVELLFAGTGFEPVAFGLWICRVRLKCKQDAAGNRPANEAA
jgi:hypothetical protein